VSPEESDLHAAILPAELRAALARLGAPASERGFYLAGGTALALQLGHRRSVDLGWFREGAIPAPLALAADLQLEVQSTSKDTLHALADGARLSFFGYRYPLLRELVPAPGLGCGLASTADIAAMKLAAVAQRGARKDFYDLVALGRAGMELADMLACYREKFSVRDVGHVLVALTWFDDAERDPEPLLETGDDWEQAKATLRARAKQYAGE